MCNENQTFNNNIKSKTKLGVKICKMGQIERFYFENVTFNDLLLTRLSEQEPYQIK